MRFKHLILLTALCCGLATAVSCRQDNPDPAANENAETVAAPEGFSGFKYGEWTYMIRTAETATPAAGSAISLLKSSLDQIDALLPASALQVMHQHPIWMEKDLTDGAAWYHNSKDYLISQGYMTEKWRCVELCNYVHFVSWTKQNQPYMVLHELCHLYHDLGLPGGFENPDVKNAYKQAMDAGLYVNTPYRLDANTLIEHYDSYYHAKVYATTNCMEYFSEICEAYWGENDYYPFDYQDLKEYDPYGFALMEKVWGPRQ